jgi:hypothetical protein
MSRKCLVYFGLSLGAMFCVTAQPVFAAEVSEVEQSVLETSAELFYAPAVIEIAAVRPSDSVPVPRERTEERNAVSTPTVPSESLETISLAYDISAEMKQLHSRSTPMSSLPLLHNGSPFPGGMGWRVKKNVQFSFVGQNFSDTDHPGLPHNPLVRSLLEVEYAIYGKFSWSF